MVRGSARLSSLYSKSTTFERSVSPRFEWGGIGMGMVRKNRARGSRRADPHSQQPGEKTRRGTRQKTEPWCQSPTARRNHLERPRLRNRLTPNRHGADHSGTARNRGGRLGCPANGLKSKAGPNRRGPRKVVCPGQARAIPPRRVHNVELTLAARS